MAAELQELLGSIDDPALRTLATALLGTDSRTGPGFRLAPAAKHNHHAYLGGLLEHTLSVTRLCQRLADHYGDALDRDLLVTAALLHDVGKVRELGARAGFPYTDEGKLLGHILLGLQMVDEAAADVPDLPPARLLLLRHIIAAHQGRYEWQSPREPATLEALVLHYADDLDAKYNQVAGLLAPIELGWTAWDRSFRREFLRHRVAPPAAPEPEAPGPATGSPSDPSAPATGPARPPRLTRQRPEPPADPEPQPAPRGASASPHPRRNPRRRDVRPPGPPSENVPESPATGRRPYPRLSDDTLDLFERP